MKKIVVACCLFLVACQSKPVRVEKQLDKASASLAHLAAYKEIECDVQVAFSEPAKSAWLTHLGETHNLSAAGSSTRIFLKVQEMIFKWRSTPYRCRMTSERADGGGADVKALLVDTERKLDTVFCIWIQSFYADSPLRGWRKGEGELDEMEGGVQIKKGESKALEVTNSGRKITARLGDGAVLTGDYEEIGGKLYPRSVSFQKAESAGSVTDINYTHVLGRELPASFWVNLNQGHNQPAAYVKAEISSCRWN